jgi:hypothetical protein
MDHKFSTLLPNLNHAAKYTRQSDHDIDWLLLRVFSAPPAVIHGNKDDKINVFLFILPSDTDNMYVISHKHFDSISAHCGDKSHRFMLEDIIVPRYVTNLLPYKWARHTRMKLLQFLPTSQLIKNPETGIEI